MVQAKRKKCHLMLFMVLRTIPSHLRLKIQKIVNLGSLTLAWALRGGKGKMVPPLTHLPITKWVPVS